MKNIWRRFDVSLLSFAAAIVFAAITAYYHLPLAIIEAGAVVLFAVLKWVYQKRVKNKLLYQVQTVAEELNVEKGEAFSALSVACCVIDADGAILWLNDAFSEAFSLTKKTPLCNLQQLLGREQIEKLIEGKGFRIKTDTHYFAVYSSVVHLQDEPLYLLYFFDETALRQTEKAYYDSRPSVMLTVVDNADELYQDFKESECAAIFSMVEQMIDDWAVSYGGLCRKFASGRMLIIVEEKSLKRMMSDKFNILDRVRDFTYEGRQTDLTLSIGVGRESSFAESNNAARQSLDMAQSRGGDQAAIRHDAQYQFYGGVSAGFERKNKAKTRLIAKTMAEHIRQSSDVFIMGHRFADYDAVGAAIGLYEIATYFDKQAHIVLDSRTSLSAPLCDLFRNQTLFDVFVSPDQALSMVQPSSLLFVVDTHKTDFTECPPLLEKADDVIVIDHHRKAVGFIESASIFYHIPSASSASEMVTELAQYMDKKPILDPMGALALFAGIMLDTRNFVLRTGVRTFEAAAYLRSRGANTVEAKKLFSTDMEIFRLRNRIIDHTESYRGVCAISVTDEPMEQLRLITSQAADEMLNLDGIKASFVVFQNNDSISISARSYGEINVQLIMEALGGGGHQTMAACQLEETTLQEAVKRLHEAIDQFLN